MLIITGVFLCKGCDYPCDEKFLGEIKLSNETNVFLPYDVGDVLVFKNFNEQSKSFTITKDDTEKSKLCTKVICDYIDPEKGRACEYFEGESHSFTFEDDGDTLFLYARSGLVPYEDAKELFYEYINFGLEESINTFFAGEVTKVLFDSTMFDSSNSIIDSILVYHDLYIAYDESKDFAVSKSLNQVWVKENVDHAIAVAIDRGVIAFRLNKEWWFLEE